MRRCSTAALPGFAREPESGGLLYRQVRDFLERAMAGGSLATGSRLPSTRELAVRLGVSRNTVLRAYETLEDAGWISGRAGSGTLVVKRLPPPPRRQELDRLLQESHYPVQSRAFCDPDGNVLAVVRGAGRFPALPAPATGR